MSNGNRHVIERKEQTTTPQERRREEFVQEMIEHVKPRILSNYFVVNDRPFPIIAPEDIIEKENSTKCSFWYAQFICGYI
nr:unnamed protein product [Naegleria fowleri]